MMQGNLFAMFSSFRNFSTTLDILLDEPQTTLEQVLDEENLISALNMRSQKLVDFFSLEKLNQLLEYIVVFPPDDSDSKRKFKYPFVATEVLCAECEKLTQKMLENEEFIEKFFQFLNSDTTPIQAGYFSRVFLTFLSKNPNIFVHFLAHLGYFNKLINLVEYKSICEIIEKIIIFDFNIQEKFVKQRIDLIKRVMLEDEGRRGDNAVRVLCNVFLWSGEWTVEVLGFFMSDEFLDWIFVKGFEGKARGLDVIQNILSMGLSGNVLKGVVLSRLCVEIHKIKQILRRDEGEMRNSLQETVKVFGPRKLAAVKVLRIGLESKNEQFLQSVKESEVLSDVFELLWEHEWNSFLHFQVLCLSEWILLGLDVELKVLLAEQVGVVKRIVERFKVNPRKKSYHPEIKPGYDGVLIKIANLIDKQQIEELQPTLQNHSWSQFKSSTLTPQNLLATRELGGYSLTSPDPEEFLPPAPIHPKPYPSALSMQILEIDTSPPGPEDIDTSPLSPEEIEELDLSPNPEPSLESFDSRTDEIYWRF